MIEIGPTREAVALWSSTLDALSSRLSARSRASIAASTSCLEVGGSALRVTARAANLRNWVRSGVLAHLEQALESVADGSLSLALIPVTGRAPLDRDPRLEPASFIAGPTSAAARDSARDFAVDPTGTSRLLVGPGGSGKSHLLRSAAAQRDVPLFAAESLSMDVVQAIWDDDLERLRRRLRDGAALVVDGLERLEGRETTQEELATALADLEASHRPALLSSARPPEKLALDSPALRDRLERCETAHLSAPGWETRVAIVLDRVRRWGIATSPDVATLLASRLRTRLDDLDATLTRLLARCGGHADLTELELVRELLDAGSRPSIRVSPDEVIALVTRHFDLRLRDLRSPSRSPRVTTPRQIAMYLVRRHCGLSYPEIGRRFDRHHTTAIHSDRLVQRQLERNASLRSAVVLLEKELLQLSQPDADDGDPEVSPGVSGG